VESWPSPGFPVHHGAASNWRPKSGILGRFLGVYEL
jgi:hypothetical protein